MRVLMCGDRNWSDRDTVRLVVGRFASAYPDLAVCHGAARGADSHAGIQATQQRIPVTAYPAQWDVYGRKAGPIRNAHMLKEFHPDVVVAFHADLDQSKGTKHMVGIARKAGVPVVLIRNHADARDFDMPRIHSDPEA